MLEKYRSRVFACFMVFLTYFAALGLLCESTVVHGAVSDGGIGHELDSVSWPSLGQDSLAPFQTASGAWILGGGLAASGLALWYESSSGEHFQNWMTRHRPLGSTSKIGDLMGQTVPNVVYAGAMLLGSAWSSSTFESRLAAHRARLMIEATAWAALFSAVLKLAVHEERPDHSDWNSFPSGHATTAFAFASVVAVEHRWYWGVAAYGVAGFVGISRINDNRHYLHDVIAGAAIGSAFGVGVSALLEKTFPRSEALETASSESRSLSVLPLEQGGLIILSTTHF